MFWQGVFPAITTPFKANLTIDFETLKRHADWLVQNGAHSIIAMGSLGEGAVLSFEEKEQVLAALVDAIADRVPLIATVSATSTSKACMIAKMAERKGVDGLMVLPPYVYKPDERELNAYIRAVVHASELPCMLYNNPIAYGTDIVPEQIAHLTDMHNLAAVKESSGDPNRISEIKERIGDRLAIFVGIDTMVIEGVEAGAVGWVAGVPNALPAECLELFETALKGQYSNARLKYDWLMPLMTLDVGEKFVQKIKLLQSVCTVGSARVRPPRMELVAEEREEVLALIRGCLASRPGGVQV